MRLIVYILLFLSLTVKSQTDFYTFDMTADCELFFTEREEGFAIGNAIEELYFEVNIVGDLDLNYQELQIMNAKITVYGDTLNSGNIIKQFPGISELVVLGNTLTVDEPIVEAVRIYPNPTVDYFFVAGNDIDKIKVFDMYGRLIIDRTSESQLNKIPIQASAGVYYVRIEDINGKGIVKKLILKN